MGYPTGEANILTLIRTLSAYSATNSSRKDWSVRNAATNGTCVVLRRGPFSSQFDGNTRRLITWQTVIEVWQRLTEYETSANALDSRVMEIIDKIDTNRKLNDSGDSIVDAFISGGDEPVEITLQNATNPTWLKQELICEWREETDITFTE